MPKHNGLDYPLYEYPDVKFIECDCIVPFQKLFEDFCVFFNFEQDRFSIDESLVIKSFCRTDQRKLHYKMYHNDTKIDELKEAAILCYWLIHYKPITFNNGDCYSVHTYNEKFAIYLIICVIARYKSAIISLTERLINDVLYTLSHRNMTLDTMTILVEAMAESV